MIEHNSSEENNEYIQRSLFDLTSTDKESSQDVPTPPPEILPALLGLANVKGIGFGTLCAMFDSGFLTAFALSAELDLRYHQFFLTRKWHNLHQYILLNRDSILSSGNRIADNLTKSKVFFICYGQQHYPRGLLKLMKPPRWIFGHGNPHVLDSESIVAIVGSRQASVVGKTIAYDCAAELVKHNIIVLSGLANGIDQRAHEGAVEYFGQTIAVLGHGLNSERGSRDEKLWHDIVEMDGAIISEYLPDDFPSRENFLRRNELQVALSKLIIAVEYPDVNSGTGATIRRALSLKVPVVGLIPHDTSVKSLLATRENLASLGNTVRVFSSSSDTEFWLFLRELIPTSTWNLDDAQRQSRFFRKLKQYVDTASTKLDLNIEVMQRFVDSLKMDAM